MPKFTKDQLEIALRASLKSPVQKKFGAVLIYKKKIISVGYNYYCGGLPANPTQCLLRA
jgi:deoxycytidylate deaminase